MDWIERMYYFNNKGNMKVFSKEELIKRGSCCACGCKNCPYTKPRVKGNSKLET